MGGWLEWCGSKAQQQENNVKSRLLRILWWENVLRAYVASWCALSPRHIHSLLLHLRYSYLKVLYYYLGFYVSSCSCSPVFFPLYEGRKHCIDLHARVIFFLFLDFCFEYSKTLSRTLVFIKLYICGYKFYISRLRFHLDFDLNSLLCVCVLLLLPFGCFYCGKSTPHAYHDFAHSLIHMGKYPLFRLVGLHESEYSLDFNITSAFKCLSAQGPLVPRIDESFMRSINLPFNRCWLRNWDYFNTEKEHTDNNICKCEVKNDFRAYVHLLYL